MSDLEADLEARLEELASFDLEALLEELAGFDLAGCLEQISRDSEELLASLPNPDNPDTPKRPGL